MTALSAVMSRAAARAKGEDFRIDPAIGPSDLLSLARRRGMMALRGRIRFAGTAHHPFVGRAVTIRARRKIHLGAGVTLADGCVVDAVSVHGVHLGDNVTVGRNTRIECTGSIRTIGWGIDVGDSVGMGTDCFYGCAGGITIGTDTIVGNFVSFHSESHVIADRTTPIRRQGVSHRGITIGDDCWIGAKATILDGARVGRGSVVAAGAVVVAGEYAPFGIYGGVPARRIGDR